MTKMVDLEVWISSDIKDDYRHDLPAEAICNLWHSGRRINSNYCYAYAGRMTYDVYIIPIHEIVDLKKCAFTLNPTDPLLFLRGILYPHSDVNIEKMGINRLQIWLMYPKSNLQVAGKFASKVANLQLANLVQKNGRPKNH